MEHAQDPSFEQTSISFLKLEDDLYEGRMKLAQMVLEMKILMFIHNFVINSHREGYCRYS